LTVVGLIQEKYKYSQVTYKGSDPVKIAGERVGKISPPGYLKERGKTERVKI